MALPAYSPRAGEISDAEQALSLAALDPVKTGSALPLLFGAQAVRQDAFNKYNQNNAYDQMLASMQQAETARHQRAGDLTGLINSKTPGALALATKLDPTRSLFAGADPTAFSDINNISGLQSRDAEADIAKKTTEAAYSGVQSGYTMPIPQYQALTGVTPVMKTPLSTSNIMLEEAGRNARSAQSAIVASRPVYGVSFGADGKPHTTVSNVDPSQLPQALADAARIDANQPSSFKDNQGTTFTVPNQGAKPSITGVLKDKKTKEVKGPIPGSGGVETSAAPNPPADAIKPVTIGAADQARLKQQYVNARGQGLTGAQLAQVQTAIVGVGEVPGGQRYITVNGKLLQPLVPVK